jgi:aminotransferase
MADQVADARRRGVDVLTLAPYPLREPAPHIIAAAEAAMRANVETPSRGDSKLCEAVAHQVSIDIGRAVNAETEVLITNGAMQALNIVFRTLLEPGDEVIIPSPCYYFQGCVGLAGGVARYVPMTESTHFGWNVDAIAAAVTPRSRALVVNTPVNPTGHVLTGEEIEGLARLARVHDLYVVADESYDRMIYDGRRHLSLAAVPELASRLLLVKSLTKSYAMPAWRVGYLVGPAEFVEVCVKALEWELLHSNHVAHAAAAAAITGPQDGLVRMAAEFQAARDHLLDGLAGVEGIRCVTPQGGPFLFLNIADLFASSQAASDALLEAGVPTVPGWYCQSDSHVRLSMGAPATVLDEVVRRLAQVAQSQLR